MTKNERLEAQQSKPFTNIYVKNLKGDCTDEELKTMFADFGPISSTCTKYFEKTGTRYGFVDFENSEDAALVSAPLTHILLNLCFFILGG